MTGVGPCDALRLALELAALELVVLELVVLELVVLELVPVEPTLCPALPPPPGAAAAPMPFCATAAGASVARTSAIAMARRAIGGRLRGLISKRLRCYNAGGAVSERTSAWLKGPLSLASDIGAAS